VPSWIDCRDAPARSPERLWSNVFPIVEMPSSVLCFSSQVALRPYFEGLPFIRQSDHQFWAFEHPSDLPLDVYVKEVPWQGALAPGDVARKVVRLLRLYTWDYLALRGLQRAQDEDKTIFYFPEESEGKRKLGFTRYTGRKSWVQAAGERRFRIGLDRVEISRYHLAPDFIPRLSLFPVPVLLLRLHVYLTDVQGVTDHPKFPPWDHLKIPPSSHPREVWRWIASREARC